MRRDFDQLIVESIATAIVSTVKKATAPLQTKIELLELQVSELRGALGIDDDRAEIRNQLDAALRQLRGK